LKDEIGEEFLKTSFGIKCYSNNYSR